MLTAAATVATGVAAGPTAAAAEQTLLDNPRLVLVGPATVLGDHTVVRVATGREVTAELQTIGITQSSGVLQNSARLLKVSDGMVDAPVTTPPSVKSSSDRRLTENFLVFPKVTSTSISLIVPGIGIVENVPVVDADKAPFSLG